MNFLLRFVRNPRKAFAKVAGSAEVSSDLTSVLLGGVALSYLIVIFGASPELKRDPGNIANALSGLDYHLLPVLGVFMTLVLAVVSHLCGKLYAILSRLGAKAPVGKWDPKLGGSVEDSVNAALGFAAVYLPLAAGVICASSWLSEDSRIGAAVSGLFLGVFFLIYFPWSLSSTHRNTGFGQALLAFGGSIVLIAIAFNLLAG